MSYIYHGVPERMEGRELIPLNRMKDANPELYAAYAKKYEGREEVMERRIPLLDCLWNDVTQFLPLHPAKVFQLQKELGLIKAIPPIQFYEIDLQSLDSAKTVVYFKSAPGDENIEVKWLSNVDFKSLQDVPPATKAYYETLVGTGELPFNYQFVPHVLTMDIVDVSRARVIAIA